MRRAQIQCIKAALAQTVELTNENKGHRDDECEDIATDWLVVLAMSLGKEVQDLVDVVFTECLGRGLLNHLAA